MPYNRKKIATVVWVGIFFIILFAILELSAARRALEGQLMPVLFWFEKPFANLFLRARIDSNIGRLLEENRRLQEEIMQLKNAARQTAMLEEFKILSMPKISYLEEAVIARVIGTAPEKRGFIFLDGGSKKGIREGDIVFLPANTLVGYIERVHSTFSIAKTLFSADLRIAATVGEERLPALFSNLNESELATLSLIPRSGKVEPGFIAETSGKDGLFPAGMLLGIIEAVEDMPAEVTRTAKVRLQFLPAALDYVLISKNPFIQ